MPTAAGISAEQIDKVSVVYIGTHANQTSDAAKVLFPGLSVFEKSGSFVNQQFRLQKFEAAVPGPTGVPSDAAILSCLLGVLEDTDSMADTPEAVWRHLSEEVPALTGNSLETLPGEGQLIDGSEWDGLPFIDGPGLHYEPISQSPA